MNRTIARAPVAAAAALLLPAAILLGTRQSTQALPPTPSASAASVNNQIASVLPRPSEERWKQIPWRTNLMQARAEAQRTGKPLFLWVMDGNPLGCT